MRERKVRLESQIDQLSSGRCQRSANRLRRTVTTTFPDLLVLFYVRVSALDLSKAELAVDARLQLATISFRKRGILLPPHKFSLGMELVLWRW